MPQKLFKITPPQEILWNLLQKISYIDSGYYIVNYESYNKMFFLQLENYLFDNLINFYNEKKTNYITDKLNYKRFLTIIRQFCNVNKISCIHSDIYEGGYYKQYYRILYK